MFTSVIVYRAVISELFYDLGNQAESQMLLVSMMTSSQSAAVSHCE